METSSIGSTPCPLAAAASPVPLPGGSPMSGGVSGRVPGTVHPAAANDGLAVTSGRVGRGLPELALIGVAVIWGVNIPVMKGGLERVDWYSFNAFRLTLSACVLGLLGWRELRSGLRPASGLRFFEVLIYAVLASVIYQFLFLLGISRATSVNTGLIVATIPMWTALAARIFLKEQLPWAGWLGLAVALTGTLIVTLQKAPAISGPSSLAGNLCMLAAALSWAFATVYSRPLMKLISPTQLSASASILGLPFHILIAMNTLPQSLPMLGDLRVSASVVYSGLFSTGLALVMWNFGVRHAGAAQAAIFQNLIPVVAVVTSWLFRGESITVAQMIGGTMIIFGLLILRRSRQTAHAGTRRDASDP